MTVNEKLKSYIQKRGIKQTAIAEAIGMNNQNFNAIINGKVSLKVTTLESICEFLRVDPAFFLSRNSN